ncbi:recombinase RecA [Salinigranum rubrum]|uniref:non-specific serine/threonine protein kinase n=1 Tax=Salinigranum rubrum TaxID=755307 RepID=A0A2I8VLA2_9EURY|nr:ATPase domain-containing protein [Salinigranum rubrum]AUV82706.1 recombinase RecA [Salinigranum rubrum]
MVSLPDGRISTGISDLDDVLCGGLIPSRSYMVSGDPGTGKTILGLHFLTAGEGESLYVNLEEPAEEITRNAAAVGIDTDDVTFLDLSPAADVFVEEREYDVFTPDDVEGSSLRSAIVEAVYDIEPARMFIDPMSELQHLAPDTYQLRQQVSSLLRFLREQDVTLLFTTQSTSDVPDDDLQYLSDGTFELTQDDEGRHLRVTKFRGSQTRGGAHTVRITDDGIVVYPVLIPDGHVVDFPDETISAGIPELNQLLGGGLSRGTVTIINGPSGVGKTTLGAQVMKEAAGRGERSVIYMFEETTRTFVTRCTAVDIPVDTMVERGTLRIEEVQPLTQSPAEFASMVRTDVEERNAEVVLIDGIDGYRLSIRGEDDDSLHREIGALCRYLRSRGVTTLLVDSAETVTGEFRATHGGVSYIADNILFLRYLEVHGELRKAIGVLKKRTSDYERALREFRITEYGLSVGAPLRSLRGILEGTPEVVGDGDAWDEHQ